MKTEQSTQGRDDLCEWTKVRIRKRQEEDLRLFAQILLDSLKRGGILPPRFVGRQRIPMNYIIDICLLEKLSHRIRSTTGLRKKELITFWERVAKRAQSPPFDTPRDRH